MSNSVCILLATYNGEKYLSYLLDSLLAQTYQDFVCCIHDDGSKDNTVNIVRNYCVSYPEHFILDDGPSQGGAKKNFMYLLSKYSTKYQYFMFCDQDDVWVENKLDCMITKMHQVEKKDDIPILLYSDMKVVDDGLNEIANSFIQYNNLGNQILSVDRVVMKCYAAGCTMMFNQKLAINAATNHTDTIIMHDWWIMIVASLLGEIIFIDDALVLYRQHSANVVGAKKVTKISRVCEIIVRILSLEQFRITRKGLYTRIYQLQTLSYIYEAQAKYPDLVDGAKSFFKMQKMSRIKFVLKFNLYHNKFSKIWTCICA